MAKTPILKIWNLDGSKSLTITQPEMTKVKAMLAMLPDDGKMIPENYALLLQGKKIPLRKILLEKPAPPENSELNLDI